MAFALPARERHQLRRSLRLSRLCNAPLHASRNLRAGPSDLGESNPLESQDLQRDKLVSCLFVGVYYVVVDLGEKGGVKAIGDLGETDVEADFDDLWDGKILRQALICGVVDGQQLCGLLSVSNNGRLSLAVDASGQRVITQVPQLFFADSDAPTEHLVVWQSVVAAVNDGCRRISEFRQGWRELIVVAHRTDEVDQGARLLRIVGE